MRDRGLDRRTGQFRRVVPALAGAAGAVLLAALVSACDDAGSGPDGAPEVVAVSPEAGAANAPVVGSIVAWFSEPLDPAALDSAIVLESDGRGVRGTIALRDGTALEFTPSDPLDFGSPFRATIRATVADRAGEHLARDHVWTFTTQGAPPPVPDRDSMRAHILVLSHDSLMGRAAGTPDELRAAGYLAAMFERWGLDPLLATWIQPFRAPSLRTGGMLDSRNVMAVVPGSGALASEWVIVGAHYDAQGTVPDGAGGVAVRNGADDNASGTATMLELARLYARQAALGGMAGVPRRTVLFAGFGSEEEGLVGSCDFVATTSIPSQQMAAMMNFDMVGRLRGNTVTAQTGGSATAWADMLANADRAGLVFDPTPACKSCSDYSCFGSRSVPYLWFFTGTHPDYHTPRDDEPLIDYAGMTAIAEAAYRVLTRLVVAPGRPASAALAAGVSIPGAR